MTTVPLDVVTGIGEGAAQLLAHAAVGFSWRTDSRTGDAPLFIALVPTSPDRVAVLTPALTGGDPVQATTTGTLQLRFRGGQDARDVWGMAAASRRVLRGRFPTRLANGIYIATMSFAYGTSIGRDDANRWEWTDSYRFTATEPR
ncbi:minor capsid protein [uncultured Jatrophihabitans sp.]|uniref:minor capsid protein n=1 Tax=uncultured Jatrophihabitans sp. TaxID=1610747 RepID=UPI0035CB3EF3